MLCNTLKRSNRVFHLKNSKNMITMSLKLDFLSKLRLFICPFENTCILPKKQFLCKIPECKNCPIYVEKLKRLK